VAVDFVCGFEDRIVAVGATNSPAEPHWNNYVNTPVIQQAVARTGASAARFNPSATTRYFGRTINSNEVVVSFYIRYDTFNSSTQSFCNIVNSSGSVNVRCGSTGLITVSCGASGNISTGFSISTGVWYRIDLKADSTTGTASGTVMIDGANETTASAEQLQAPFTDERFGFTASNSGADAYIDDIVSAMSLADYPIGAHTVEGLIPAADGTHSFTAGDFGYNAAGGDVATSATDVQTYVDESDLTSVADFIRQKVVRSTGYVEVGDFIPNSSANPIAVACVLGMHASGTTANTVGWKFNDGGTIVDINDRAGDGLTDISNTGVTNIYTIWPSRPAGGSWTLAALTALKVRFGYSTNVATEPYWDNVLLEVAFPPGGGGGGPGGVPVLLLGGL